MVGGPPQECQWVGSRFLPKSEATWLMKYREGHEHDGRRTGEGKVQPFQKRSRDHHNRRRGREVDRKDPSSPRVAVDLKVHQPFVCRGSFPGATVSLSRICPSTPFVVSSPPPCFFKSSRAASWGRPLGVVKAGRARGVVFACFPIGRPSAWRPSGLAAYS